MIHSRLFLDIFKIFDNVDMEVEAILTLWHTWHTHSWPKPGKTIELSVKEVGQEVKVPELSQEGEGGGHSTTPIVTLNPFLTAPSPSFLL